jgi:hypothetical protein
MPRQALDQAANHARLQRGLERVRHLSRVDLPAGDVQGKDRVRGLRAGGDDYLAKPFALADLDATAVTVATRQPVSAAQRQSPRWRAPASAAQWGSAKAGEQRTGPGIYSYAACFSEFGFVETTA